MNYDEFLKTKELKTIKAGFEIDRDDINDNAFDYQKDIIEWACRKGSRSRDTDNAMRQLTTSTK